MLEVQYFKVLYALYGAFGDLVYRIHVEVMQYVSSYLSYLICHAFYIKGSTCTYNGCS